MKCYTETAEYQNQVSAFVSREVIYCLSTLINELAKNEKHMDDLMPVLSQDDWETTAIEDGAIKDLDRRGYNVDGNYFDTAKEYCEERGIEPQKNEALEHWLVSGWLANKLEAKGEMILRGFMGFRAIWGRTTSGQSIAIDSVICEIYNELNKAA